MGPRSSSQKLLASIAIPVSVVIVLAAQRDLHRRSDSEIRGSKLVWRVLCLNALGALGYFRWGRRGSPAASPA